MLLSVPSDVLLLAALSPQLSLSKHKEENGQAQAENQKPYGFEYRYLNGLKVPYYCTFPPLSKTGSSMGMAIFPSMVGLALP
jgi:hypothetical protein